MFKIYRLFSTELGKTERQKDRRFHKVTASNSNERETSRAGDFIIWKFFNVLLLCKMWRENEFPPTRPYPRPLLSSIHYSILSTKKQRDNTSEQILWSTSNGMWHYLKWKISLSFDVDFISRNWNSKRNVKVHIARWEIQRSELLWKWNAIKLSMQKVWTGAMAMMMMMCDGFILSITNVTREDGPRIIQQ